MGWRSQSPPRIHNPAVNVHDTCTVPAGTSVPAVQTATSRSSARSADRQTHPPQRSRTDRGVSGACGPSAPERGLAVLKSTNSGSAEPSRFLPWELGCAGRTVRPRVSPPSRTDNSPSQDSRVRHQEPRGRCPPGPLSPRAVTSHRTGLGPWVSCCHWP